MKSYKKIALDDVQTITETMQQAEAELRKLIAEYVSATEERRALISDEIRKHNSTMSTCARKLHRDSVLRADNPIAYALEHTHYSYTHAVRAKDGYALAPAKAMRCTLGRIVRMDDLDEITPIPARTAVDTLYKGIVEYHTHKRVVSKGELRTVLCNAIRCLTGNDALKPTAAHLDYLLKVTTAYNGREIGEVKLANEAQLADIVLNVAQTIYAGRALRFSYRELSAEQIAAAEQTLRELGIAVPAPAETATETPAKTTTETTTESTAA